MCVRLPHSHSPASQIRACDDKTRAWYEGEEARSAAYGAAPQPPNVEEPAEAEDASAVPIPPHNGFGDEDDSLRNCMAIDVRAPRPDLSKFLAFDGTVYRLYARLDGAASGLAAERRFTLALFPADDTLQILEAGVSACERQAAVGACTTVPNRRCPGTARLTGYRLLRLATAGDYRSHGHSWPPIRQTCHQQAMHALPHLFRLSLCCACALLS